MNSAPSIFCWARPAFLKIVVAAAIVMASCQLHAAAPTVVGLWRFNEGSGVTASDSSGLGNTGTLRGESTNFPAWVSGHSGFGDALYFHNDTTNHSYVDIPPSPTLMIGQTPTNTWSITAWAYEIDNGSNNFEANYGRILVLDDGTALQLESGATNFNDGTNDDTFYTWSIANSAWQLGWTDHGPVSPLLDQWEHWAVVYDGTNLNVYRNGNQGPLGGVLSQPVTAPLGYPGYQGAVRIASQLSAPAVANWNGMLDDVAIFNGALNQQQVQTVMGGDFSAFIGGPAQILTQPQNQTVPQGTPATFSVGAIGSAPFHYQWYLDGATKLDGATNANLTFPASQYNQIGLYSVVVSNASNVVASQSARLVVYDPRTPLVALWRFNEDSGNIAHDSSGLENDGTLEAQNGNSPDWAPGQPGFGTALSFTNDSLNTPYVNVPGNESLMIGETPTNSWSITAWANESSDGTHDFVATYGRILVIDDGTALQLESGASGDDEFYTWARANTAWQIGWGGSSVDPLLDQWEHWAVVYDGTNLTLYLNGNQGPSGGVSSMPVTAAIGYAGYQGGIHIGSELGQGPTRTWNGLLDDIAVFDVALNQTQVRTVMSGDFTAFLPHPPLSISVAGTNAVLTWPANFDNFQPQFKTNLTQTTWSNVLTTPTSNGSVWSVSVPLLSGDQFFQLIAR